MFIFLDGLLQATDSEILKANLSTANTFSLEKPCHGRKHGAVGSVPIRFSYDFRTSFLNKYIHIISKPTLSS